VTFSLYVKNTGSSSGNVVLELMIPDEINSGNVSSKITVSAGWTKAAGTVGTTGFSSTAGTKQRVTLTKSLGAGVEESLSVTINYSSDKTSYIDGSIDDIAA
jgi:archaellum component FlaG (FlaF/FlaG flagellin family)